MVRTLLHRAETIVTEEEDKQREIEHVKSALRTNGYPEWIFRIPKKKSSAKAKDGGADWRRGRVVDFGPRGPGFNPQTGRLSL